MSLIDGPGQLLADVRALLDAANAVNRAATPEEEAAARLLLDTEVALQMGALVERGRARARELIRRQGEEL